MLVFILLSSFTLAFYDYTDPDNLTQKNKILEQIGEVFTVIFIIECVLKIIGYGLILHFKSYLRNGWNFIDFVVASTG